MGYHLTKIAKDVNADYVYQMSLEMYNIRSWLEVKRSRPHWYNEVGLHVLRGDQLSAEVYIYIRV